MDRDKQREIASKGGRAAHAKGTAHEFDSGEARDAGRKGGVAVSRNREHMAAIGRRGGEARGHARGQAAAQANTAGAGSAREGAFQNSRAGNVGVTSSSPNAPISSGDRQVAIDNQREGVSQRAVTGGEKSSQQQQVDRRPLGGAQDSRNDESFGH
jgi:general stress protein YciG